MASDSPRPMTAPARAAFEIYRDLGRSRTLKAAAELLQRHPTQLRKWSAKHDWVRLCAEHDHAALKESLGQREIDLELGTQTLVDLIPEAIETMRAVMLDKGRLPILDRQGNHARGPAPAKGVLGELLYKPTTKPSTQLEAAKGILGIAGLVPVKRMEHIDKSGEQLDAAANVLSAMSPKQVLRLIEDLDEGENDGQ